MLKERRKDFRYALSFLKKKLVHTNLQILYNCNFKCRICDFWKDPTHYPPPISLDNVKIIGDKLSRIGPQIISIGGGEPLLHPKLTDIVATLSKHHYPVMICNGWYMTDAIAKELFAAGMYEISVSVDYADPVKHDHQRGTPGAYDRAIGALETCLKNRVHSHQRVHMISVIMDDNLDQVEPLIKLCKEIGITYLVTLYSDHRGNKRPKHISSNVSNTLLTLKDRYKEFVTISGYIDRFSEAISLDGITPCYAGRNLCNIDSNGDVSLCIDRIDEPVGNILTDDITSISDSLFQKYEKGNCNGCWTSCRGTVETLMYGNSILKNLGDYYQLTKRVPI